MCGIVGTLIFKNSNFEATNDYIQKMRDIMSHRGPDGAGLWISADKKIGLGHRRLSIIDLSTEANQPMSNHDNSIQIVFNGEIYNYLDIKSELEKINKYKWKTDHSDTEVIIHAYEEWGIDCIRKCRGMFAIALWDYNKKVLYLIRDRMGIKPLYYSIHNNRIVFASEIKALLQDPDQIREVNEKSLYHYLSFLTTPSPDTLFKGIKKLPNSCYLKISLDGSIEETRYWDMFDNHIDLTKYSEEEIADQLINELRTSVKLRKIADVPVGVFLSGGIDSSANTVLFSEGENSIVKTFSIGYEGNYQTYKNELEYARKVAKLVNAEHHELLLTVNDLIEFIPKMVFLQDEPIADPVCFPVYFVSKLARENGVIVCQVGEGSDELFCGYPSWQRYLKLNKYNNYPIPKIIKQLGLDTLNLIGKKNLIYYEWLNRGINGQPIFWGGAEAFTESHKKIILSESMLKKFENYSSWEVIKPIRNRFLNKASEPSFMNWMTYMDFNFRLPELLLMRVDKMSSGVSLEGRVPFLDHKFVELAMSIPTKIKVNKTTKYIFKKAVKNILPPEIINRQKQGFGVPIHEWLYEKLGSSIKTELMNFCNKTNYLRKVEVTRLIENPHGHQLWFLYNLAMWWKHNFEN
jgi:asparagine synthase (glutamine-hydrolysing)